jgi:hypothetical protein
MEMEGRERMCRKFFLDWLLPLTGSTEHDVEATAADDDKEAPTPSPKPTAEEDDGKVDDDDEEDDDDDDRRVLALRNPNG